MNTLSWTLYLVDIVYTFKYTLIALAIVITFGLLTYLFTSRSDAEFYTSDYNKKHHPDKYNAAMYLLKNGYQKPVKWAISCIVVVLLLQIIPSKQTAYMILASEAGEYAATTEGGQKIISDVKEIISIQLDKLKQ